MSSVRAVGQAICPQGTTLDCFNGLVAIVTVDIKRVRAKGSSIVPKSVLDAIKQGVWDFEPTEVTEKHFDATEAMPGTDEKLEILAARVQAGLPLWHKQDRTEYDDE